MGNLPRPVATPPSPPRTHTLKTAVTASQIRYQKLTSACPLEKTRTRHLSSASSTHQQLPRSIVARVMAVMILKLDFDDAEFFPLTGFNTHGQTLLHLWQTSRPEYHTVRPDRHIAQDVAARAPFGTERTAALHRGTIYTKSQSEIVVAALGV